ncbi:hypothetical protein [Haloechinothrix sp. LS1_15]|uniref:hypothetical protein n=1 Tax=Haloechinothrix sp. LS1_15 TaxID=2652248 RepID=UPI0029484355|nr:hypothetical protein [Haloechinothrix sp. LS1_15]MDV6013139.1 hypothetical protein [Haloechinothrix sp. LS1_15]
MLLAVLAYVAHRVRQRKAAAHLDALAQQLDGIERTNDPDNQPSFGVRPRRLIGHGGIPRERGDFDRAIEARRGDVPVLLVDYTVDHPPEARSRHGNSQQGARHMVQVQTPLVPTLCIQRRPRNFRYNHPTSLHFVSDEELAEYATGDARFDELFQVLTASQAFAADLLTAQLVGLMTSDEWFHRRMIVFESGTVWTQDGDHMADVDVLDTVDRLIRFARTVPSRTWEQHAIAR